MSGIFVVAFLVHCGPDLLLCDTIDTRALRFRDMGACQARIDDLIVEQRRSAGAPGVVMGKCRYLLVDPPRAAKVARAPEPGRAPSQALPVVARNPDASDPFGENR